MRFRLALVVVASFLCAGTAGASSVDKLARHLCHGEEITWEDVLNPNYLGYKNEFVDGAKLVIKTGDPLEKCKNFSISGDLIRMRYEKGEMDIKTVDSKLGLMGFNISRYHLTGDSFDAIGKELDGYPGTVAAVVKDGDGRILFSRDADRRMATGSSFKLFILKALVDDIEEGKRSWPDIVKLDKRKFSLPSGKLQDWPDGSPVTLHTLATLMISISDNTATDHLIDEVGRGRLEAMMPGSSPFLKTMEMFALKLNRSNHYLKLYLRSDVDKKRDILRRLEGFNLKKIIPGPDMPISIDKIEWFASPNELADVILSMRGERILSINSGEISDKSKWKFIGFKGGSEPGVLQATQILQSKSGRWYAVSISWNDAEKDVDKERLGSIVNRLADLIK